MYEFKPKSAWWVDVISAGLATRILRVRVKSRLRNIGMERFQWRDTKSPEEWERLLYGNSIVNWEYELARAQPGATDSEASAFTS